LGHFLTRPGLFLSETSLHLELLERRFYSLEPQATLFLFLSPFPPLYSTSNPSALDGSSSRSSV
jgi:hypothetical protein